MGRLAKSEPARREKCIEDLVETEPGDSKAIELLAFVVEGHHPVGAAFRDCPRNRDRIFIRLALLEHEAAKLFTREIARLVKDGDIQIFVECYLALLELPDHFLVARLKVGVVELEPLDRKLSLLTIPAVCPEHAAYIEENVADHCHLSMR